MKFIVFYLQFINSVEGQEMFFSSAALVRRLRRYAATGTSRNIDVENREPAGDRSQNDPYPEEEFSACRSSNSIDSDHEETSHSFCFKLNIEVVYGPNRTTGEELIGILSATVSSPESVHGHGG